MTLKIDSAESQIQSQLQSIWVPEQSETENRIGPTGDESPRRSSGVTKL